MLASVLVRFICRITLGVAVAMLVTRPRQVSSGFYRVHMWVLLGLNTFCALLVLSATPQNATSQLTVLAVIGAAIFSYVGSVAWLYEKPVWGRAFLAVVAVLGMTAAINMPSGFVDARGVVQVVRVLDDATAGLLLGATLSAMFLGHWYLSHPGMELAPLRRLMSTVFVVVGLRAMLCGGGLVAETLEPGTLEYGFWAGVSLRWAAGLIGVCLLVLMSWQTLKVPNTQSATGILYVAVICACLGELTSQVLSFGAPYPL